MSMEGRGAPGGSPRFQEGGTRGERGFLREREPKASVAHIATTTTAVTSALIVATGSKIFQPKLMSWS